MKNNEAGQSNRGPSRFVVVVSVALVRRRSLQGNTPVRCGHRENGQVSTCGTDLATGERTTGRRRGSGDQGRTAAHLHQSAALGGLGQNGAQVDAVALRTTPGQSIRKNKQMNNAREITLPAMPGHLSGEALHLSAMTGHLAILAQIGHEFTLASDGHFLASAPACCGLRSVLQCELVKSEIKKKNLTFPANPGHLAALARAGHLLNLAVHLVT